MHTESVLCEVTECSIDAFEKSASLAEEVKFTREQIDDRMLM